jgi:excisionase family DNA binding protein
MIEINENGYYKLKDIEKLGFGSVATIRRWIKEGKIKAGKVGKNYIIKGEELKSLIEKSTEKK